MTEYDEKLKTELKYLQSPFQVLNVDNTTICNLEQVNQLTNSGRVVLKYVVANLNKDTSITILDVITICKQEFPDYPNKEGKENWFYSKVANTLEIRIRRGIKNLLHNKVIAKSKVKNEYFVNKAIIWK